MLHVLVSHKIPGGRRTLSAGTGMSAVVAGVWAGRTRPVGSVNCVQLSVRQSSGFKA